jgi:hypothetical protein
MPSGRLIPTSPPGVHSNEGSKPGFVELSWDSGHGKSSISGENNYSIEPRSSNRSDGARFERTGMVIEKPGVLVQGQPMNKDYAQTWEDKGLLKAGSVGNATPTLGWSKASPEATDFSHAKHNNKPNKNMSSMSNDPKQKPELNGPSPSSMGDSSNPPTPPETDLSKASGPTKGEQYRQEYLGQQQTQQPAQSKDHEQYRQEYLGQQQTQQPAQSKDHEPPSR